MKHIFIVNPCAGKKDQRARIYEMADRLRDRHGLDCACMLTDRPGGAEAYAATCPSHGRGVFFSRAGDYQIAPKPPSGRLWVVYGNLAFPKGKTPPAAFLRNRRGLP